MEKLVNVENEWSDSINVSKVRRRLKRWNVQ